MFSLSVSSPLGEFQSTTCGLFQSAVNSRWSLCIAFSLYDSAIRFERDWPFSLWFAVILIKGKRQRVHRETASCGGEDCGGLSSAALGLRHMEIKVNVKWRLRALVFVRRSWRPSSRLDLISVDSVSFQGNGRLLYFTEYLLFREVALQLWVFTAECGLFTDYRWLQKESKSHHEYAFLSHIISEDVEVVQLFLHLSGVC